MLAPSSSFASAFPSSYGGVASFLGSLRFSLQLNKARRANTPRRRSPIMTAQAIPYGRVTQRKPAVAELHILWITAGLGCDGDSVSLTPAPPPRNPKVYPRANS